MLHGVALINYNEHDNCLAKNLHSMTCYGILHPKSPPLSSENLSLCFASPINRSTPSFLDTAKERVPSSFISSICFNIPECHSHICIFCSCLELINQTFLKPGSPIATTQRLLTEEDEQPLSVHPSENKS